MTSRLLMALSLCAAVPAQATPEGEVESFLGAVFEEDGEYREAFEALSVGARQRLERVAEGRTDHNHHDRIRAIGSLGFGRNTTQEPLLLDLVEQEFLPLPLWHAAMITLPQVCTDDGRLCLENLLNSTPILPWKKAVFTLQTLAVCGGPQDIPLAEAWTAHPKNEVARKAQRAVETLSARFPDAPVTAQTAATESYSMIDVAALAALEPPDPVVVPPVPPSPDPRELMEIYNPPRAILPEGWDQPIAAPAPALTPPPPPAVTTTVSAPTGSPTAFPALLADMTALQTELARATSSTLGSEFIAVFNNHATELTAIFNNDPSLGGRIANLVDAFGGLANRLVEGTLSEADFFLAKELQHQMDALLRDLYAVASRPLASDLHKARNAEKQALFEALRAAGMSDDGNFGKKGVK